jgi:hypothetical protein
MVSKVRGLICIFCAPCLLVQPSPIKVNTSRSRRVSFAPACFAGVARQPRLCLA